MNKEEMACIIADLEVLRDAIAELDPKNHPDSTAGMLCDYVYDLTCNIEELKRAVDKENT